MTLPFSSTYMQQSTSHRKRSQHPSPSPPQTSANPRCGWSRIVVDIQTIRLIIDNIGVSPQCIKDRLCNIPVGAIGTVEADLDALEGVNTQGNQITHITVTAGHIVHGAANVLTMSKR